MARTKVAMYDWKPTKIQKELLMYAIEAGDNFKPTVWLKSKDRSPSNWTKWKADERFCKWFFDAWDRGMKWAVVDLDRIGMERAKDDFNYWKVMQQKYGGLESKGEGAKTVINFNIPRPKAEKYILEGEEL